MGTMKNRRIIANFMLLMTATIWGLAFVAQRVGMEYIGPLTFGAVRFWLSSFTLLPICLFLRRNKNRPATKNLLIYGLICGTVLFFGSTLQQTGLVYTTAGKAGFITALYMVLVAIFGIIVKRRVDKITIIAVILATVGLYLLCIKESFEINFGDFVVFLGAFFWAAHVLFIDKFVEKVDPIDLATVHFFVCATLSTIAMFIFEDPQIPAIMNAGVPIVYAGVFSGAVAFTFQFIAQKYTTPTATCLILSLEAAFAAIAGFLILTEILTLKETFGCILMLTGVILSQLKGKDVSK